MSKTRPSRKMHFGFALVLLQLCGACQRAPQATRQTIVFGAASTDPRSSSVIQIFARSSCTATVVAENMVLTARHCVTQATSRGFECDENGNGVGLSMETNAVFGDPLPLENITVGPRGAGAPRATQVLVGDESTRCKTDVAFVVVDRSIDNAAINAIAMEPPPPIGGSVLAEGWGMRENRMLTERTPFSRVVQVVAVGPTPRTDTHEALPPGFWAVNEGLCSGDSGSAALVRDRIAVGVAAAVENGNESPGNDTFCLGPVARGRYASLAHERALVERAFRAAGTTPRLEGDPDPRASRRPFGESCEQDRDCRSGACVADARGVRTCSIGCVGSEVPAGEFADARACPVNYQCRTINDRTRCMPEALPDAAVSAPPPAAPPPRTGGCSVVHAGLR